MDEVLSTLNNYKKVFPPFVQSFWIEILVAFFVGTLFTTLFLGWQCLCRRTRGRNVCLLGLSNSGKTLLFLQLTQGKYGPTQNSITVNVFKNFEPEKTKSRKPITLVDVPGNERVRERYFSNYKDSLRGVVVVIDSLNFPSELHDLAELLYDLFSDHALHKARAPVLLACNKQDIALARNTSTIRQELEEEMQQLQASRGAKLLSLEGGKTKKPVEFIKKGRSFKFADLPSWMGVEFASMSARGVQSGDDEVDTGTMADIKEVQDWIGKLCQ